MSEPIRTAVIGTGHFGRHHVAKYAALPESTLVAVADSDPERRAQYAAQYGVEAVADYRELAGRVDAVSIAVPSSLHGEVGRFFLEHGVHVLMEKPISDRLDSARALVDLARERNLILQVGHLERFSAVRLALGEVLTRPIFIESTRISPFQPRVADVSVILDLMIHDIDMVLSLTSAAVSKVDAVGAPVFSGHPDVADTRLTFDNGGVADVIASRIARKAERRVRLFQPDSYVSVDLVERTLAVVRRAEGVDEQGRPRVKTRVQSFEKDDPLAAQVAAFVHSVQTGTPPIVGGEEGLRALETALRITESLEEHMTFVRGRLAEEGWPSF